MVLDKEESVSLVSLQSREKPRGCAGCNRKIRDRFMLQALDRYWHEDCLKCACCDCRLGRLGSTLYTRANLILCRRDYLRLFGVTGNCAACSKLIPAFEMVMRARDNVYHLDCFACQLCRQSWTMKEAILMAAQRGSLNKRSEQDDFEPVEARNSQQHCRLVSFLFQTEPRGNNTNGTCSRNP
uniref:Rhombotin-1 n=1 Tax=Sparus aurata TaxID=8175 RepID=A0A7L9QAF2_SPAAU|nr:rhombotin-1 [Sparus aurata]